MADLIIKPATSGDSVKFQGSDSSAQFTIAGTTGSLGSGITYPAGHIIQTKAVAVNTVFDMTVTTAGGWHEIQKLAEQNFRITITPASISNKLLIRCSIPCNPTTSGHIWQFRFAEAAGTATPDTIVEPYGATSGTRDRVHWADRIMAHDSNDPSTLEHELWADVKRASETTYTIQIAMQDSSTSDIYFNHSSASGSSWEWTGVSTFVIQEIQQ